MAQPVKCLSCKCEDLCSDLQCPCKESDSRFVIPLVGVDAKECLELTGQVGVDTKMPLDRWRATDDDIWCQPLVPPPYTHPPHTWIHTSLPNRNMCVYTHTNMHARSHMLPARPPHLLNHTGREDTWDRNTSQSVHNFVTDNRFWSQFHSYHLTKKYH